MSRIAWSPLAHSRASCFLHTPRGSNKSQKNNEKSVPEPSSPINRFQCMYRLRVPVTESNSRLLRYILDTPYTILMFFLGLLAKIRSFFLRWSRIKAAQKVTVEKRCPSYNNNVSVSSPLRVPLKRMLFNRTVATASSAIVSLKSRRSLVPLSASSVDRHRSGATPSKPSFQEPTNYCLVHRGESMMTKHYDQSPIQVPLNLTMPLKEFRGFTSRVYELIRDGQNVRVTCPESSFDVMKTMEEVGLPSTFAPRAVKTPLSSLVLVRNGQDVRVISYESFLNAVKAIKELALPSSFAPRALMMPQSSLIPTGKISEANHAYNKAMAAPSSILKVQNVELSPTLPPAGLCEANARLCLLFKPDCIVEVSCSNTNFEIISKCMKEIGLQSPSRSSAVKTAIMPPQPAIVPRPKIPSTSKPVFLTQTQKFGDAVRKFAYDVALEKLKETKHVERQTQRCPHLPVPSEHNKEVSIKKTLQDIQTLDTSLSEFSRKEINEMKTVHLLSIQTKPTSTQHRMTPNDIKKLEDAFARFRKERNSKYGRKSKPFLTSQSFGRQKSVGSINLLARQVNNLASSSRGQRISSKKEKQLTNNLGTRFSKTYQKYRNEMLTGGSSSFQNKLKDILGSKAPLSTPLRVLQETVGTSSAVDKQVTTSEQRLLHSYTSAILQKFRNQAVCRDEVRQGSTDKHPALPSTSEIEGDGFSRCCRENLIKSVKPAPIVSPPSFGLQASLEGLAAALKKATSQEQCIELSTSSLVTEKEKNMNSSNETKTVGLVHIDQKSVGKSESSTSEVEEDGFARYCKEYVSKPVRPTPLASPPSSVLKKETSQDQCIALSTSSLLTEKDHNNTILENVKSSNDVKTYGVVPISQKPLGEPRSSTSEIEENGFGRYCGEYVNKSVEPTPVMPPPSVGLQKSIRGFVLRQAACEGHSSASSSSSMDSEEKKNDKNDDVETAESVKQIISEKMGLCIEAEDGFAKFCKEYVMKSVNTKPVLSPPSFGLIESVNQLASTNRQLSTAEANKKSSRKRSLKRRKRQMHKTRHIKHLKSSPSCNLLLESQFLIDKEDRKDNYKLPTKSSKANSTEADHKSSWRKAETALKVAGYILQEAKSYVETHIASSMKKDNAKESKQQQQQQQQQQLKEPVENTFHGLSITFPSPCTAIVSSPELQDVVDVQERADRTNVQQVESVNTRFQVPLVTDFQEEESVNTKFQVPLATDFQEVESVNTVFSGPSSTHVHEMESLNTRFQVRSTKHLQEMELVNTGFQKPSATGVQEVESVNTQYQVPSVADLLEEVSFNMVYFQEPSILGRVIKDMDHEVLIHQSSLEQGQTVSHISSMLPTLGVQEAEHDNNVTRVSPVEGVQEMGHEKMEKQLTSVREVQESLPVKLSVTDMKIAGQLNITQSPSGLQFQVSGDINTKDQNLLVDEVQISGNVRIQQSTSAEGVQISTNVNIMPSLSEREGTDVQDRVFLFEDEVGSNDNNNTNSLVSLEQSDVAGNGIQLQTASEFKKEHCLYTTQVPFLEETSVKYLNTALLPSEMMYQELDHFQTSHLGTDVMLSPLNEEIKEGHTHTSTFLPQEGNSRLSECIDQVPSSTAATFQEEVYVEKTNQVSHVEHGTTGCHDIFPLQPPSPNQEDEILTRLDSASLKETHDTNEASSKASEANVGQENEIEEPLLSIYTQKKHLSEVDEAIKIRAAELIEKGIFVLSDTGTIDAILNPSCVSREEKNPDKCSFSSSFNHASMSTQSQQKIIRKAQEEGLCNRVVFEQADTPLSPVACGTQEDCDGDQIMGDASRPIPTSSPSSSRIISLYQPYEGNPLQTAPKPQMSLYSQYYKESQKDIDIEMMSDGQESFMDTDSCNVTQSSLMECEDCADQVSGQYCHFCREVYVQSSSLLMPSDNLILEQPIKALFSENERSRMFGLGNPVQNVERPIQSVVPSIQENKIQYSLVENVQVAAALASCDHPSSFSQPSKTCHSEPSNNDETQDHHAVSEHVTFQHVTTSDITSTVTGANGCSIFITDNTSVTKQDNLSSNQSGSAASLENNRSSRETKELTSVVPSASDICAYIDIERLLDDPPATAESGADQSVTVTDQESLDETAPADSNLGNEKSVTEWLPNYDTANIQSNEALPRPDAFLDEKALCLTDEGNSIACQTSEPLALVMPNCTIISAPVMYKAANDASDSCIDSTGSDLMGSVDEDEKCLVGEPLECPSITSLMPTHPNKNQAENCSKQPLASSTVPQVTGEDVRPMGYRRKIIVLRKRNPISATVRKVIAVNDLFGEDRRPSATGLQATRLSRKKRLRVFADDEDDADSSTELKRRRCVHFSAEVDVCGYDTQLYQNHSGSFITKYAVPRKGILKNSKNRMSQG